MWWVILVTKMKAIHYDAEGDILAVTFAETNGRNHTGVELSDNIVLYLDAETGRPYQLILVSYQAMVRASARASIALDGLDSAPATLRATIVDLLQREPLTAFLQIKQARGASTATGRLVEVFTPSALQSVAVS